MGWKGWQHFVLMSTWSCGSSSYVVMANTSYSQGLCCHNPWGFLSYLHIWISSDLPSFSMALSAAPLWVASKPGSRCRSFVIGYQTHLFIMKLYIHLFLQPHVWLCFLLCLHCFSCCPCPLVLFPAFKSGLSCISFLGRYRQIFVSFWPIYFFSSF